MIVISVRAYLGGASVKNPPANAGDVRDGRSIPGLKDPPEGGHGSPLQCCCLENPMDRGAWWATVHRLPKRWTWLKRVSMQSPLDAKYPVHFARVSACQLHSCINFTLKASVVLEITVLFPGSSSPQTVDPHSLQRFLIWQFQIPWPIGGNTYSFVFVFDTIIFFP